MSAKCGHLKAYSDGVSVKVKNKQKNVYLILYFLVCNYTFIEEVLYLIFLGVHVIRGLICFWHLPFQIFGLLFIWISFLYHVWKNNINSELLSKKIIILESISMTLTKNLFVQIMGGYPHRDVIEEIPSIYVDKKVLLIFHLIEKHLWYKNKCYKIENEREGK